MKMKLNLLSFPLAVCLLFCCLTGCGGSTTAAPATTDAPESASPAAEASSAELSQTEDDPLAEKYAAAYAKYDPDTVVLRVNGTEVPWSEYFYWIYTTAYTLETNYGVTDWSAAVPQLEGYLSDPSYGAYVLMYAETNAIQTSVIEAMAEQNGATLTEEQQKSLEADIASYIEETGGEEAFENTLRTHFLTREYFTRQNTLPLLYSNLVEVFFGANGEKVPEADVIAYLTENGYLHAKHILFKTVDDARNPLDEASISAQRARAEEVLATLQDTSSDELESVFDAMMAQYSEDPGFAAYPNGYYFTSGQMVSAFENAVLALEENGLSDIVESEYGFHIIYRPAMRADDLMDYDNSSGEPYTARALAADELFYNMAVSWYDAAAVEFAPEFEALDLNDLLPIELEER